MVNVPVPPYTRGAAGARADRGDAGCRGSRPSAPQMIFISAGFDAHRDDELGQLGLVEADYAWITAAASRRWPSATRRAASSRASKAATTSARWRAASPRTCACSAELDRCAAVGMTAPLRRRARRAARVADAAGGAGRAGGAGGLPGRGLAAWCALLRGRAQPTRLGLVRRAHRRRRAVPGARRWRSRCGARLGLRGAMPAAVFAAWRCRS